MYHYWLLISHFDCRLDYTYTVNYLSFTCTLYKVNRENLKLFVLETIIIQLFSWNCLVPNSVHNYTLFSFKLSYNSNDSEFILKLLWWKCFILNWLLINNCINIYLSSNSKHFTGKVFLLACLNLTNKTC